MANVASIERSEARGGKKKRGRGGPKGPPQFLEPITSKRRTRRFSVIDIESKSGDSQDPRLPGFTRPFLVGLFDVQSNEYHEFRDEPHLAERPWETRHIQPGGCIDKLLNVILQESYAGSVFYAHSGGGFDFLFLLTWLREHRDEYDFEVVPIQSTIQVIRVWRRPDEVGAEPKERWEFLDSMRLVPMSLDKACQAFLPKAEREAKGKIKVDLGMDEDDPRWSAYLKADCVSLATVMQKLELMVEQLGGELGMTAPATAMKLFRRTFMGKDGVPERIDRHQHWPDCRGIRNGRCLGCAHEWIRAGYCGGRTEIHEFYGERLRYYDLNSSYVHAMRGKMPIGERRIDVGALEWRRHTSRGGRFGGFCECTVTIPEGCRIPPLPYKDPKTGKLIFPTGTFSGVWSVEELALLDDPLVEGKIEHVVKTVWFRLLPMFGSMVTELWKLRDTKREGYDEGLSQLAKLLGNSTYGKFAMKQDRSSVVFAAARTEMPDGHDEVGLDCCFLCRSHIAEEGPRREAGICAACEGSKPAMPDADGDVWYQRLQVDAAYIIPQVAAHITALARVRLWKAMKTVVVLSGRIYYTDTDSIITDITLPTLEQLPEYEEKYPGVEFVPISSRLGDLKDEYPGEELRYTAVQPKVYMIEPMRLAEDVERRRAILDQALHGTNEPAAGTIMLGPNAEAAERVFVASLAMRWTSASDEVDASTLDGTYGKGVGPAVLDGAAAAIVRAALAGDERVDASAMGTVDLGRRNYVLEPYAKVTMKGFPGSAQQRYQHPKACPCTLCRAAHPDAPPTEEWTWREVRTKDNLAVLQAGGTLYWRRLEKARSLARLGFRRPPAMMEVSKAFRSEYDKRERTPDGGTRPRVIQEDAGAQAAE